MIEIFFGIMVFVFAIYGVVIILGIIGGLIDVLSKPDEPKDEEPSEEAEAYRKSRNRPY